MSPQSREVDRALAERLPDLVATAMALTGEPGAAARLIGEVIARAGQRRDGVDLVDPGPGLRNLLVARYVAQRPASPAGLDPAGSAPDGSAPDGALAQDESAPSAGPAELDEVTRNLDELSRPQRAALLLSLRDRLTFAEIAGILDRPVGKVAQSVAEAQTQLEAGPYAIAAAFDRLGAAAPDVAEARAAAVQFRARQAVRRRRVSLLGAAAVLVLALALALPTVILPRLFPVPVRAPGVWAYGYDVAVPAGWHLSQQYLQRDQDSRYLVDEAQPNSNCGIAVSGVEPTPVAPSGSRSVRVRGRPGWYGEAAADGVRTLTWSYAPKATAVVSCDDHGDVEQLMLEIARRVTFTTVPLLLPFRLDRLPVGYEVYAVGSSFEFPPRNPTPVSALVLAPVGSGDPAENTVAVILPGDRPEGRNPHTVKVQGTDAVVQTEEGSISLCLPAGRSVACLSSFSATTQGQPSAEDPDVRRLVALAESLSFATDLNDQTTWFDARQALPG